MVLDSEISTSFPPVFCFTDQLENDTLGIISWIATTFWDLWSGFLIWGALPWGLGLSFPPGSLTCHGCVRKGFHIWGWKRRIDSGRRWCKTRCAIENGCWVSVSRIWVVFMVVFFSFYWLTHHIILYILYCYICYNPDYIPLNLHINPHKTSITIYYLLYDITRSLCQSQGTDAQCRWSKIWSDICCP